MSPYDSTQEDMMPTLRGLVSIISISGVLGTVMFSYLHFSETNYFPSIIERPFGFFNGAVIGLIAGTLISFLNRLLDKWLPWRSSFSARFFVGYFSSLGLSILVLYLLANASLTVFGQHAFWPEYSTKDADMNIKVSILLSGTIFIYIVVYALLYSYQQYAVAQLENLQRERRQMELQFEALKSQLSPHYLFNSLNTISSLIFKDTPSAEQFIRRLAQTYQYILSTQHKRFVTLREEVDFVQSYYYLLRIRFQQQLHLEINLPNAILSSKIPPLTLQILVENAVKHNTVNTEQQLFIYISAPDNTYLKVMNTKIEIAGNVTSFRLGLENIRQRYQFFTSKKIEIRDEEKFSVMLPVIPNPVHHSRDYKHIA
jgi:hypothetical protein